MKRVVLFIGIVIMAAAAINLAAAGSLFDLTIPSDPGDQQAIGMSDHSANQLFDTTSYDRKWTYVAFDYLNTRYSNAGPDAQNSWLGRIWSGTQEVRSNFNLILATYDLPNNLAIELTLYDYANGPEIGRQILLSNQQWAINLPTHPVAISQWRTQGYKAEITLVPEPTGTCIVILFVTGVFGQIVNGRRR